MKKYFALSLLTICCFNPLQAAYTLKHGKLINTNELATLSVQEHYSLAQDAYQKGAWEECLKQTIIVKRNFPTSPFVQEVTFYQAVSYYNLKDYDFSNQTFSEYLKKEAPSKHFEDAIAYKFKIAEKFKEGEKKHVFGRESLPKWLPAKEDAIGIYDEVIAALPHHDLGAQALYGKAQLLLSETDYQESIETLHTLIRRFSKHPLAPESYLFIGKIYLTQCKNEYPDPDLLDLADINMKKFHLDFPTEPRLENLKNMHVEMQEVYAKSLYETGNFYERTKKPHAAILYYSKIVAKYPDSKTAKTCEKRIVVLQSKQKAKELAMEKAKAKKAKKEGAIVQQTSEPITEPVLEEAPKQPSEAEREDATKEKIAHMPAEPLPESAVEQVLEQPIIPFVEIPLREGE